MGPRYRTCCSKYRNINEAESKCAFGSVVFLGCNGVV